MVQKTTQKKNPGVFSKTIMLQLLDVGRNGIVFQTLNIKQNTMLFFQSLSMVIHFEIIREVEKSDVKDISFYSEPFFHWLQPSALGIAQ